MDSPRAADGERRVTADQWDTDGWQILASEADKVSFEVAKSVYERLVFQFSSIGKFWKSYAEHLAREQEDDHEAVIAIYERAVQAAPTSIELWRSYLTFVTDLAMKVPGSKLESDAIAVHEKAVTVAGLDLNAHPLWSNYIEFLKHSTLGDSQRRDALRRVYQRAVIFFTPIFLPHVSQPSLNFVLSALLPSALTMKKDYSPNSCLLQRAPQRLLHSWHCSFFPLTVDASRLAVSSSRRYSCSQRQNGRVT